MRNLFHLCFVQLVFLGDCLGQFHLQISVLGAHYLILLLVSGLLFRKWYFKLCNTFIKRFLLVYEDTRFYFKVVMLCSEGYLKTSDLSLQDRYSLYKLALFIEIGIADQLWVIHLDHLKFLCCGEFLLNEIFTFACMRQPNVIYLGHKTLFTLNCLLLPLRLDLIH